MQTILIVDDEDGIRLNLRIALQNEGFRVEEAADGEDGLRRFRKVNPDLVILDIWFGENKSMTGYDVCLKIREESSVPIIFLSHKGDEADQLVGYDYGRFNVDYVPKSELSPKVLARKVRSKLYSDDLSTLEYGKLRIDLESFETYWGEQQISLTKREFFIVRTLLKIPNKVHTRNELMERTVEEETIDSQIRSIRRKFESVGAKPIETVHGRGFRLFSDGDS